MQCDIFRNKIEKKYKKNLINIFYEISHSNNLTIKLFFARMIDRLVNGEQIWISIVH